jgi:hypothetical protein
LLQLVATSDSHVLRGNTLVSIVIKPAILVHEWDLVEAKERAELLSHKLHLLADEGLIFGAAEFESELIKERVIESECRDLYP